MFKRRSEGRARRIDTLIGKGGRIQGDLEFVGGLHLDGCVAGSVRASAADPAAKAVPDADATLSISQSGQVEGSVVVPNVLLDGAVRGDIFATGRVVLGPSARVEGNVIYGSIEMAAGAEVQGRLTPQAQAEGAAGPGPSQAVTGTDLASIGTNELQSVQASSPEGHV